MTLAGAVEAVGAPGPDARGIEASGAARSGEGPGTARVSVTLGGTGASPGNALIVDLPAPVDSRRPAFSFVHPDSVTRRGLQALVASLAGDGAGILSTSRTIVEAGGRIRSMHRCDPPPSIDATRFAVDLSDAVGLDLDLTATPDEDGAIRLTFAVTNWSPNLACRVEGSPFVDAPDPVVGSRVVPSGQVLVIGGGQRLPLVPGCGESSMEDFLEGPGWADLVVLILPRLYDDVARTARP